MPRSRSPVFRRSLAPLLAVAVLTACADLAMEPDRVPASLTLSPSDTLVTQGERSMLRVTVLDQDGNAFSSLPSWAPPTWSVSEDGTLAIGPDGSVDALAGGEVLVRASLAGLSASSTVRVNPREVMLSAPTVYLVQSTQNAAGDVPLVAGRKALLRVFTTGDRTSFYQPRARATFYQDGEVLHTAWMSPGADRLPSAVDESRLDRSFNAIIPGPVLQPGVAMVVELDPESVVPLAVGSRIRVPEQGTRPLDVRAVPPMQLVLVPVLLEAEPDPKVFNWTGGMTPASRELELTRSVHPIGELSVEVHEPFTTSADLTTEGGWSAFLREMAVLRMLEGDVGYYYGAVVLPPHSKWGGLGYVGFPASVGAPSASTLAHELGHNLSLRHAPCGGVASFDPAFPHKSGSIGVWGYDFNGGFGLGEVMDPGERKDLMGYCNPRWVSDYHFKKALTYRTSVEGALGSAAAVGAPRPPGRKLLLWGSAGAGELILEPAFVVDAPTSLPRADGPYRLEGFDGGGARLFSLSFAPREVEFGGGHFAFALDVEGGWHAALAQIVLTGPEGSRVLDRTGGTRAAVVTDRGTGHVVAIVRDAPDVGAFGTGVRLHLSDGLPAGDVRGGGAR